MYVPFAKRYLTKVSLIGKLTLVKIVFGNA